MSADKRKVSTDALETLGTIIGPNEKRDAIHLAVIPAEASATLFPGQSVSYRDGVASPDPNGIGIVDPFLADYVHAGQRFWFVLRPRLITSLRHVWTHPDLPDETGAEAKAGPTKAESEAWLRKFCETADCPSYNNLIALMTAGYLPETDNSDRVTMSFEDYGDGDTYLYFHNIDAHGEIPPEFWTHIENVTGKTFPHPTHFSCSC